MYDLTDEKIAQELGERFKALRLRKNISQQALAKRANLSLNTIKALENGNAKLSTVIAVLRELSVLEQIDLFIPAITISPIQLAKRHGKERHRASKRHKGVGDEKN